MESQHDVRGTSGVMISQPELLDCLVVLRDMGCRNACLSCVGDKYTVNTGVTAVPKLVGFMAWAAAARSFLHCQVSNMCQALAALLKVPGSLMWWGWGSDLGHRRSDLFWQLRSSQSVRTVPPPDDCLVKQENVCTCDLGQRPPPVATAARHSTKLAMADSKVEEYLLLVKGTKGRATADLVQKVTSEPGIFAFGEFLDALSVVQVSCGCESLPRL